MVCCWVTDRDSVGCVYEVDLIPLVKIGKDMHKQGARDEVVVSKKVRMLMDEYFGMLKYAFERVSIESSEKGWLSFASARDRWLKYIEDLTFRYMSLLGDEADAFEYDGFVKTREKLLNDFSSVLKVDIVSKAGESISRVGEAADGTLPKLGVAFGSGDVNADFRTYLKGRLKQDISNPSTYVKTLSGSTVSRIQRAMMTALDKGFDLGWSKDQVLAEMGKVAALPEVRAQLEYNVMRVMRTSYAKAANEVTYQFGQENKKMIAGYRRVADGRPCILCMALDGKFYEHDEPHDDHPNGMCRWVPVLKPLDEMGFKNVDKGTLKSLAKQQEFEPLASTFSKMPDAELRQLFGNEKLFRLFKDNDLSLDQLVKRSGNQWTVRSASEIEKMVAKGGKVPEVSFMRMQPGGKALPVQKIPESAAQFGSKREAEKWFKKNGTADKIGIDAKKVDARRFGKGVKFESITDADAASRLGRLADETKRIEKRLGVKLPKIKELNLVDIRGQLGGYATGGDVVVLGSGTNLNLARQWVVGSAEKDFMKVAYRHEMGHVVDRQYLLTSGGQVDKAVLKELMKLSQYAKTNAHEAFAEGFSYYTSPLYGTKYRRLSKEAEKFFDDVVKKMKSGKLSQAEKNKLLDKELFRLSGKPSPEVTVKFESIDDAKKWFGENGASLEVEKGGKAFLEKELDSVRYKEIPISEEEAVSRLGRVGDEVSRIQTKYGIEMPRLKRIDVVNFEDAGIFGNTYSNQRWVAGSPRGEKYLITLGQCSGVPEGIPVSFSVSTMDGDILATTFRHEMGHVVSSEYNLLRGDAWRAVREELRSVSEYAKLNGDEAFSEGFAYYTSPKYGAEFKRLSKEAEEFFDGVMKKMKVG